VKITETEQENTDLLEMRERIAMYVLYRNRHSVANIGMRFHRSESWVKDWIAAGCPLQMPVPNLQTVDNELVTSGHRQDL
jgi:hypothetical protein